jgi:hypothetical protein
MMLMAMIDNVDGDNNLYIILTSVFLLLCIIENIYEQKTNKEVINGSGSTWVGNVVSNSWGAFR